ncbi:MAG: hypothetical protein ACXWHZ_12790 [Usitatibacter sp.]
MAALENDYVSPGVVKCQACGYLFRHRALWSALQESAPGSFACPKCVAPGPFIALTDVDVEALRVGGRKAAWRGVWAGVVVLAAILIYVAVK